MSKSDHLDGNTDSGFPELNPYPVIELDLDGKIHYANPGAEGVFPDLETDQDGHPFLSEWESIAERLRRNPDQPIVRTVEAQGRFYEQAIHRLPDSDRIRLYAMDVTELKQAEQRRRDEERITIELQRALLEISTIDASDMDGAIAAITGKVAHTLSASRVGIWRYDDQKDQVECMDLFSLETGEHSFGEREDIDHYPNYFEAVAGSRVIAVHDARNDSRTEELLDSYLVKEDIRSLLHAPIRLNQSFYGVLACEHIREQRAWSFMEREFAVSAANSVALLLESSERMRAEREMRKLLTAVNRSGDSIYMTDRGGTIEYVNDATEAVSGYSREELVGKTPRIWKSGYHDDPFYQRLWETIGAGKTFAGIFINKGKDGRFFTLDQTITPVTDESGEVVNFVATAKDVTEQKVMEEKINYLSYHDPLTGLPNRNLLFDRLRRELLNAEREETTLAVFVVDIDRFRMINEAHSPSIGDKVLQSLGSRLEDAVYERDTVARFGNDEYGIVAAVKRPEELGPLVEKVRKATSRPLEIDDVLLSPTASIGISVYPEDGKEAAVLIRNAELSLDQAKENGRNSYKFFTSTMNRRASDYVELEGKLAAALKRKEFVVYYQPYFDFGSKSIAGMEALVRWNDNGRIISPGKFIGVLEDSRLIIPVGEWILSSVCRQLKTWQDRGLHVVPVSVNLSAHQFAQEHVVELIHAIVRAHELDPSLLVFELTESVAMKDVDLTIRILKRLKDLGFSVSIDDFGTGYSSLAYLRRFPLDNLKIDRSFVMGIDEDPDDALIVTTVISMAHNLRLRTIAEGVESEEHWKILRILRCDLAQGYYCGKPSPPEVVEELLY